MSKYFTLFILASLLFSGGQIFAAGPGPKDLGFNNGNNSNPHNLSSLSSSNIHAAAGGEDRICVFCHTPHGGDPQTPLWNRPDLALPDSSYPLYGGVVEIKTIGAAKYTNTDASIQYPNGASRMCLSCHDGVTAIGEVISGEIIDSSMTMSAAGTIDLAKSHPISFVYNSTVMGLINGRKTSTEYQMPPINSQAPRDSLERMQCTTCHDPHVNTRGVGYSLPFWRNYTGVEATDYSTTCDACHVAPPNNTGTQHNL
ncbi:hypothetical protein [Geothermobacter hydrogeniphilus]|uniref:Uncharacterized protein n=1 Tax=Geothermobacter hydrogeniphilus TaxID=1969733 RepID=A0A1X0YCS4_9BACT|nr:hypothetical protein [Geothermobacter hydrogeniphilus]ORJ62916.1 hypothetical protein B5V00_02335 [Geothermobacter hydrogeniphilus]